MGEKDGEAAKAAAATPEMSLKEIQKPTPLIVHSPTASPRAVLRKQASCLCSPTTHAGSFRCRHHRNSDPISFSSNSVESRVSELAEKQASTRRSLAPLSSSFSQDHA